jgi:hypothetical protein
MKRSREPNPAEHLYCSIGPRATRYALLAPCMAAGAWRMAASRPERGRRGEPGSTGATGGRGRPA